MFGHDDHKQDDDQQDDQAGVSHGDRVVAPLDQSNDSDDNDWQHPGPAPSDNDAKTDDFTAGDDTPPHEDTDVADFSTHDTAHPAGGVSNDLIDIKQEALGKLSPLIGHLDQTPDEKFRTLMMMIQASDDQTLLKQAYDTALQIEDEKARAQALLDIVNEINYFTQNPKSA